MKKLVLIAIALFGFNVNAVEVKDFIGKYTAGNDCSGRRAYINLNKNKDLLQVSYYGDDATGIAIMLGRGFKKYPGTTEDAHGAVSLTWETWAKDNSLISVEIGARPSMYHTSMGKKVITLNDDETVTVEEFSHNGKTWERESFCELTRQSTK